MEKVNLYRVPMSKTEGAWAYVKATSVKEAQDKFNNEEIDHIDYDVDNGIEVNFEQDGKIELYDENIE